MKQIKSKSFNKGLREVKAGELAAVRTELMQALNINVRQAYARYRDGKVIGLTVDQAAGVEAVFAKRGIKDPWGE